MIFDFYRHSAIVLLLAACCSQRTPNKSAQKQHRLPDRAILADPPNAPVPVFYEVLAPKQLEYGAPAAFEPNHIGISESAIDKSNAVFENGSLVPESIARTLNEHKNEVLQCYEVELIKNQRIQGRVFVRWVIDCAGAVTEATVTASTVRNYNMEQCLLTSILSWQFPPSSKSSVVTYPFFFKCN